MMFGIKKSEDVFFGMFAESAAKTVVVGEAFADLLEHYVDVSEKVTRIKTLETECDMQMHKILMKLNGSFVTPFDREDIYDITKEIDDIVDSLEEAAARFLIFEIKEVRAEAVTMAHIILQAILELKTLFDHFSSFKNNDIIKKQIIEVNRLENEGDHVFRTALHDLFKLEKDPIELIKWKHIYEQLEDSLDSCENVANLVEGAIMKYA